jgi:hypothetical protein
MGLMDKVKAQANVLAQKTQETARDSKIKFDQAQAKRRGDVMLRNLGAVVYAQRTGRGTPGTQAEIDKLVADIKAHEAEHGINLAAEPGDQPQDGPPPADGPPPGKGPRSADGPRPGNGPRSADGPGSADGPPEETTTMV